MTFNKIPWIKKFSVYTNSDCANLLSRAFQLLGLKQRQFSGLLSTNEKRSG